ncbi:hypothetical protein PRUB_a2506 [Pseudoalteromonas rubra]|uniref:Cohesin domain-containing protein n=1 Tax=Pseudoalteromonas rubra TaxID=43658 RepID=A0A8T0CC79_9GAMM|nr:cohesin domain-containing protein [Pseudoalteromonas rubra]KAF7787968.1 hypothetical protein PRUB_a2506 [Pseudoalteromonas rubra]
MKYMLYIATLLASLTTFADQGRIYLETSNPQIKTGSEFYVDVMVADLPDVYGTQLTLNYDSQSITFIDQDTKTKGAQLEHGNFLNAKNLYVLRNQANTQHGTIQYIVSQVAPAKSASGDGRLARLYFTAPDNAARNTISIEIAEFGTRNGEKYTYKTDTPLSLQFDSGYQVQASPGIDIQVWTIGLAMVLSLIALTVFFLRSRALKLKTKNITARQALQ